MLEEESKLVLNVPVQWRDRVADTLCDCARALATPMVSGVDAPRRLREIAKGLSDVLQPLAAGLEGYRGTGIAGDTQSARSGPASSESAASS